MSFPSTSGFHEWEGGNLRAYRRVVSCKDYNHFSCLLSSLRDITFWVRRVSVILKTVILPVRNFEPLAVTRVVLRVRKFSMFVKKVNLQIDSRFRPARALLGTIFGSDVL